MGVHNYGIVWNTFNSFCNYRNNSILMETPNYWQVLKVTTAEQEVIYKIFGTWCGGYLDGDSWRLNSGIKEVQKVDEFLQIKGYSGTEYKVLYSDYVYRTTMYTQSVLESFIKKADLIGVKIEVIPFKDVVKELIEHAIDTNSF